MSEPNINPQPREWIIRVPVDPIKKNLPRILLIFLLLFLMRYCVQTVFPACSIYLEQEVLAPAQREDGLNFVARQLGSHCTMAGSHESFQVVRFVNGKESDINEIDLSDLDMTNFKFRWLNSRELRICSSDSFHAEDGMNKETRQWHEIKIILRC